MQTLPAHEQPPEVGDWVCVLHYVCVTVHRLVLSLLPAVEVSCVYHAVRIRVLFHQGIILQIVKSRAASLSVARENLTSSKTLQQSLSLLPQSS